MVIKQKATPKPGIKIKETLFDESVIDEIISRGGKTTSENQGRNETDETRFTLRLPQKLIDLIDRHRKKRVGSVSRNQWIIEAIADKLDVK